jgi:hypothetical protein
MIKKEDWGKCFIALGMDIINAELIDEIEFKANIIQIGVNKLLEEIASEK